KLQAPDDNSTINRSFRVAFNWGFNPKVRDYRVEVRALSDDDQRVVDTGFQPFDGDTFQCGHEVFGTDAICNTGCLFQPDRQWLPGDYRWRVSWRRDADADTFKAEWQRFTIEP
ncbi:hypothetical protein HC928_13260, partial [bacterium]|nr:hypothetical protein [bacterium]